MVITSLDNNRIKEIIKLKSKKYRDLNNKYIIEGEHLVLEAYKENLLETIVLKENTDINVDVEKIIVTESIMSKITDMDNSPYVIGIAKKNIEKKLGEKILLLDCIQDPGNLGTIIRSSKAFNIDTIVLSNDTVDLYNSKVIRATQGMIFKMNIIRRDLNTFIDELKDKHIPILVTNVENGTDIRDLSKEEKEKFALVLGNEGNGVSETIKNKKDKNIYIKMNNDVESLNVGVAASILLYELDTNK